jgi:transposase InsO family protein
LIHTDICDPITPGSFSRKEYFITFIDDYSRKCWVYFLEKKSEAFETFKKFKVMVEKTTGKNIRSLRSDRGGEYLSNQFKSYCENHWIRKFLTAPYTPPHNGIAEKKNQDNPRHGEINGQNQGNAKEILDRSCVVCGVHTEPMSAYISQQQNPPRTLKRTQAKYCTSQVIQEHIIRKNPGPEENQARRQKQEVYLHWIK